jgi:ribosomal protein S18 acetylase RimI-like enzyme
VARKANFEVYIRFVKLKMNQMRMVVKEDVDVLKSILDSIDLFPSEMLDDMMKGYFSEEDTGEFWFTSEQDGALVSLAYCAPEKLTDRTYNLYAIGIRADLQGKGIGGKMLDQIEAYLKVEGKRILLVETSGSADYKLTRDFYLKNNYTLEATIRDFWAEGDDKVIFWKKLN